MASATSMPSSPFVPLLEPVMPLLEQIWDVIYSARTELMMFVFAFTLHHVLFGVPLWKVSDKREKGKFKDRAQHQNWRDESYPRKQSGRPEESSEDHEQALRASDAAYDRADFKSVLRHWSTMRRSGAMASAAHVARVVEAMQRFQKESSTIIFEVRGYLKRHKATCDVAYANYLLESLSKSLDMNVANSIVEMLPSLDISPNAITYEVLVQMHFATRNFAEVNRLEQELTLKALKPTARSSLAFLKTAMQTNQLEKAITWYCEVAGEPTASIAPAHITAQLVELACKQQRLDVILSELSSGRIPLTTESLNAMLSECSRSKNQKMIEQLEQLASRKGVAKNGRTFQILTNAGGSDRARIEGLLEETADNGTVPAQVVQSIMAYCTQNNEIELADQLYAKVHKNDSMGQTPTLCALVRFYAEAGEAAKACDVFEKHLVASNNDDAERRVLIDNRTERALMSAALQCGRETVTRSILTGSPADTGKYISLIRSCVTKGNLDEAMMIFRALEKNGADLTHSLWNTALDACVECGNLKRAEDLMARMQLEGVIDAVSYNTLIKAHLKQDSFESARAVMGDMRKLGFAPNQVTYNELVHALSRSHNPQRRGQVWSVVDEMKQDGVQPNRITSSILLKSLHAKSPHCDVMRTMELTDNMSEPMDEVLLSSVVEACVRVGKPELLTQKLDKLQGKDAVKVTSAHTFGSLIKAHGCAKDVVGAWRCWKEMRSQHVKPTSITIGCMVEAVVSNGDVDGGYELVSDLLEDVACKDQVNSIVYGSVIKGYSRARRMERVLAVFEEMVSNGIEPSQTTYNAVIDACARNGQMERVPKLLDEMKIRDLQPNLITYSTVIKGYVQQTDMAAAIQTLEGLRSNRSVKIDEIVYNTLLDGCFHAGQCAEADKLFKEMQDEGIAPSNYTLTCMVKLKGQQRRVDQAFDLVDSITRKYRFKANAHVCGALVQACVSSRDMKRAVSTFEQMVQDRLQPEVRMCQALIRGLLNTGDAVRAISLLRIMLGLSGSSLGGVVARPGLEDMFVSEVIAALRGTAGESMAEQLLIDMRSNRPGFNDAAAGRQRIDRRPTRPAQSQSTAWNNSRSRADQGQWR